LYKPYTDSKAVEQHDTHISQSSILDMGFSSSLADPDVWLRAAHCVDGRPYYKYLLVYVDDIIIISKVAKEIMQQMKESYGFFLKDIGEPKSFLRADVGWHQGSYGDTWFLSPNTYLNKAIRKIRISQDHVQTKHMNYACTHHMSSRIRQNCIPGDR